MKIHCIVKQYEGDPPWIQDAWDEWTIDSCPSEWQEQVEKALNESGPTMQVRIGVIEVPDDWMDSLFKIPVTQGVPV